MLPPLPPAPFFRLLTFNAIIISDNSSFGRSQAATNSLLSGTTVNGKRWVRITSGYVVNTLYHASGNATVTYIPTIYAAISSACILDNSARMLVSTLHATSLPSATRTTAYFGRQEQESLAQAEGLTYAEIPSTTGEVPRAIKSRTILADLSGEAGLYTTRELLAVPEEEKGLLLIGMWTFLC